MNISIVCSHKNHPFFPHLQKWQARHGSIHNIGLFTEISSLRGGDMLFLISCNEMIYQSLRATYKKTLVVHASDLPKGRGWSPLVWQILEGRQHITVSLLEAEDQVDSGRIWKQESITFEGHELFDEINEKLFVAELVLMDYAVEHFTNVCPVSQSTEAPTYYRKRVPEDSRIDPHKTIADQFDLLRVADPDRYPAFFEFRGHCYQLTLTKKGRSA